MTEAPCSHPETIIKNKKNTSGPYLTAIPPVLHRISFILHVLRSLSVVLSSSCRCTQTKNEQPRYLPEAAARINAQVKFAMKPRDTTKNNQACSVAVIAKRHKKIPQRRLMRARRLIANVQRKSTYGSSAVPLSALDVTRNVAENPGSEITTSVNVKSWTHNCLKHAFLASSLRKPNLSHSGLWPLTPPAESHLN